MQPSSGACQSMDEKTAHARPWIAETATACWPIDEMLAHASLWMVVVELPAHSGLPCVLSFVPSGPRFGFTFAASSPSLVLSFAPSRLRFALSFAPSGSVWFCHLRLRVFLLFLLSGPGHLLLACLNLKA